MNRAMSSMDQHPPLLRPGASVQTLWPTGGTTLAASPWTSPRERSVHADSTVSAEHPLPTSRAGGCSGRVCQVNGLKSPLSQTGWVSVLLHRPPGRSAQQVPDLMSGERKHQAGAEAPQGKGGLHRAGVCPRGGLKSRGRGQTAGRSSCPSQRPRRQEVAFSRDGRTRKVPRTYRPWSEDEEAHLGALPTHPGGARQRVGAGRDSLPLRKPISTRHPEAGQQQPSLPTADF